MNKLVPFAAAAFAVLAVFSSTVDYAKKLTMTVNPAATGYGAADVADVPVAVRLSESISGFSYSDFQVSDGGDLLFTDESGNALAHEIEKWDESGESVVWVKMPAFGAGRKLYAYYGGAANAQNAAGVWGGYVGVWHMDEADGTVADATGNGYDAVPGGTDAIQNVATNGVLGNGRVNCHSGIAYLQAQGTANLDLGDTFTVSGWFNLETVNPDGQPTLITPKRTRWDGSGWGIRLQKASASDLLVRGRGDSGDGTLVIQDVAIKDSWAHILVVYDGWSAQVYVNGVKQTTYRSDQMTAASWVANPTASAYPITFGYNSDNHWDDGWSRPFWGAYDEIRLADGTKSAAQVAAEYAAQRPDALSYSVGANDTGLASVALANFLKKFTVSMNAYAADDTFADFPMLVRLSPSAISGFDYADFVQKDYSDLAFFDASGNPLPFDVDTWNPTGESLVWVKVPSFSKTTVVTVAYGGLVKNDVHQPATWSAYRGVWHLNETGDGAQAIADATANAMDGAAHAATAYVPAGQLGGSRRMATSRGASDQNGGVRIPFNPAMNNNVSGRFSMVASTWVNLSTGGNWGGALFMRKNDMDDGGWGFAYHFTEMNHFDYYFRASYDGIYTPHSNGGGGYTQYNASESIWKTSGTADEWHKYTVVYDWNGSYIVCKQFLDGVKGSDCWLYNFTDDGNGGSTGERSYAPICQPTDKGLALGAFIGSGRYPLLGAMDEARLRFGDTSETREALEYGQESDAAYYTYSAVENVPGSTVPGIVVFGSPLPAPAVVTNGNVISFSIGIPIQAVLGGSAPVELLLEEVEPKDGTDVVPSAVVGTLTATGPGTLTFTWNAARLGTEVRYRAVSVTAIDATHNWTSETETKSVTLPDTATYRWVANANGLWSNPANWTTDATDGLPRIGYPTAGTTFNVYGSSQTSVILVDANYEGLLGGTTLGWGSDDITFRGVVEGAAIGYPEGAGFKDGQYSNVKITLDNVALTCGSYHVYANSALTMLNGASLNIRWEFLAAGDNASLFVGDGCELNQRGVDGNRFEFAGENAAFVISNGVVKANTFRIGGSGDDDTSFDGKAPAGITFMGDRPQLQILQYAKIHADPGADIPVTFIVPERGYAVTPIVKTGGSNRGFAEVKTGVAHGLRFMVDKASPFFSLAGDNSLVQQLVDWTYNGAAYAVNTDGVSWPPSAVRRFAFTPDDGATKSGIAVTLKTMQGFSIIFR